MEGYSLAQRLRMARAYRGMSQTDLAKEAGINNVMLSKLERGVTRDITGRTLRALCQVLRVSPAYILGMRDDIESEYEPAELAPVGA